jgi:hypothetical protein
MVKKETLNHNRKYTFRFNKLFDFRLMIKRTDNNQGGKEIIVGDDQSAAS